MNWFLYDNGLRHERANCKIQKQPFRGVFKKICSENMQQIYRRTHAATLLKSHFGLGFLLWICCIFPEHLLWRTPLEGYFWKSIVSLSVSPTTSKFLVILKVNKYAVGYLKQGVIVNCDNPLPEIRIISAETFVKVLTCFFHIMKLNLLQVIR